MAYKYKTPYGEFTDYSPQEAAQAREASIIAVPEYAPSGEILRYTATPSKDVLGETPQQLQQLSLWAKGKGAGAIVTSTGYTIPLTSRFATQLEKSQLQSATELSAWKAANPTEKLIYNKQGQVTGVQSGILQKTISIDAYNKAVESQQAQDSILKTGEIQKETKPTFQQKFLKAGEKLFMGGGENIVLKGVRKNYQTFVNASFPFTSKVESLLTPKRYTVSPGASTNIVLATPEQPSLWETKPGFLQYVAVGLYPKTFGSAAEFLFMFSLGGAAMKAAPLVTSSIFTGGGGVSLYEYTKATTPEEKSIYAAGSLGLLAAPRVYTGIKDVGITMGMKKIPASKVVAPEVLQYYEGEGGTKFPYDKPQTFQRWFKSENIKKYGLPNIPKEVKGKPLGYSATSSGGIIEKTGIGEAGQFYSGKGVSVGFLRIGGKGELIGQDYAFGNKPYVYALYGEGTKVVPKAYEIKIPNPYDVGGKPIKKYIFPGTETKPGTFYIPTNKPEVQAVVYGNIAPIRKGYYFELGGRRVPIGEYVSSGGEVGKQLILKGVTTESSSSSILPYKSSTSKTSLLSSSSLIKKTPSKVISSTSKISISKVPSQVTYKISKLPSLSKPSGVPSTRYSLKSLSKIQEMSAPSFVPPSYKPSYTAPPKPSKITVPPPSRLKQLISRIQQPSIKRQQAYELQIRRQGQFKTIAKGLTLGRGKLMGTKTTTGTLGQTFRLLPKGETLQTDIQYEVPTDIFTRLKKPTTEIEYVERRGKTLKRGTGEIPEILGAKRTKTRKMKWL
jgi:hypothetical protein